MKHRPGLTVALLSASVLAMTATAAVAADSGSVLSDMSDPVLLEKYRKEATERIKCKPIDDWDARMEAYRAAAASKWDRAAMGCAVEYGTQAAMELSVPSSAIWAFVTFRVDNIETNLEVLGANLEYFDVLAKSYSEHYQGIELSSELHVRWEQTRQRCDELLARIEPLIPDVTEARILRAAYYLASTVKETPLDKQNEAVAKATAELEIAVKEKPDALNGLGQLMLGQVLFALPEFLGGDALRAIALLEEAHRLNPADMNAYRALAEAYLGERENDKAVDLLKEALATDPAGVNPQDYVDAFKFLGGLGIRVGLPELAAQFADKREAMLKEKPDLLARKETAAFGHGGEDPLTGKDPSALK